VSVLPPTVPPAYEDPEELRILEQSSVNRFRLADEATKERTFKVLEDHYVAVLGHGQSSQAGRVYAITLDSF
jgi:hypothetical protein